MSIKNVINSKKIMISNNGNTYKIILDIRFSIIHPIFFFEAVLSLFVIRPILNESYLYFVSRMSLSIFL